MRRNRGRLAAAAVILLVLLGGAGAFAWQARKTATERAVARAEAGRAAAVRDYIMLILRTAGEEGGPSFKTAKQVLDATAARLGREADGAGGSGRTLARILGELYAEMEDFAGARPLVEQSARLSEQADDRIGLATARQTLAQIATRQGRLGEAEDLLERAKRVWSTAPGRYARQLAEASSVEAALLRERGRREEALRLLRSALSRTIDLLGPGSEEVAVIQHNIGVHLLEAGRLAEGEAALDEAWRMLAANGRTRSGIAIGVINHRAAIAYRKGKVVEAETSWREAIALRRALYGPSTALAALQMNLARVLLGLDRHKEAQPLLDEAEQIATVFAGEDSAVTILVRQSRALALMLDERPDEAWSEIDKALASAERAFGPRHPYYALALSARAQLHLFSGRPDAARRDIAAAKDILKSDESGSAAHLTDLERLERIVDDVDPSGKPAQSEPPSSR